MNNVAGCHAPVLGPGNAFQEAQSPEQNILRSTPTDLHELKVEANKKKAWMLCAFGFGLDISFSKSVFENRLPRTIQASRRTFGCERSLFKSERNVCPD